ncbi:sodium/hydrogen exchanger 3-like [Bidens hawaiensis]|uniref:sodium/hydrogen exchanger 3-like n=1 Tax=Bidens hawaiensis TaxID=980011 RepID=UPI00404AB9E0
MEFSTSHANKMAESLQFMASQVAFRTKVYDTNINNTGIMLRPISNWNKKRSQILASGRNRGGKISDCSSGRKVCNCSSGRKICNCSCGRKICDRCRGSNVCDGNGGHNVIAVAKWSQQSSCDLCFSDHFFSRKTVAKGLDTMLPDLGLLMAKMNTTSLAASEYAAVVNMNLFVALLCACIVIGHLLEESRWMNESITALLIGLFTGAIILLSTGGKHSHLFVFSEDLFFIYLLPPIIFNAGFQVKKKQFFRNFMTIVLFGAIGTVISFTIISFGATQIFKRMNVGSLDLGDFLALGAIFSATDSVCTLQVLNQDETPLLYSLVFGEGVVNDATSVVIFNAVQHFDFSQITTSDAFHLLGDFLYLFVTSTVLGVGAGLLSAYVIKTLYFGRHSTDREVAIMILMAYLSYMLAELFHLSGILTVFFCGIVMSHYTWHNVTEKSRVTTKYVTNQRAKHITALSILYHVAELDKFNCMYSLVLSGTLLQHYRSFQSYLSFFMLVWMHWILKSGTLYKTRTFY